MKKNTEMREKKIEQYLVDEVEKLRGIAFKWSSPGNRGVPDRICFLPKGTIVFVECKATGKRPTPLQRKVVQSLRDFGQEVLIIDSKEMVDIFCETITELSEEEMKNDNEL